MQRLSEISLLVDEIKKSVENVNENARCLYSNVREMLDFLMEYENPRYVETEDA